MNENESTNQDQPTNETTRIDQAEAPRPAESVASTAAPKRGIKRPVLIGVGAGIALLLVGGVGLAVGMELSDDDPDEVTSQQVGDDQRNDGDDDDRRAGDDNPEGDRDGAQSGSGGAFAPSDAAALNDAAAAALDATGGTGISSIDVEHGGYEIEVQLDGGADADVFVSTGGEVSEPYDSDADSTPEPVFDLDRIDAIIEAASAAASSAVGGSGAVDSISASDDQGVAFEVTVRYDDGREFEAALADDLSVVTTDLDD